VVLQLGDQGVRWLAFGERGPGGRWSVRVPWSTDRQPGQVRVIEVKAGCGTLYPVQISETAVQAGTTVDLSTPASPVGQP
jgi:hypothetical protein